MIDDAEIVETHRPALLALAYRMLGDMAGDEDTVQDAWVRWQNRRTVAEVPKVFLLTPLGLCGHERRAPPRRLSLDFQAVCTRRLLRIGEQRSPSSVTAAPGERGSCREMR
jgi:hypothetical protein